LAGGGVLVSQQEKSVMVMCDKRVD
jgi:hypothetical protein